MATSQRIAAREPAEFTEAMQAAAKITKPGRDGRMQRHYATFINNPYFLERWARMAGTVVLRSSLSNRQKMMVVMRLARLMRCSYAWVQRQAEKDPKSYMADLHTKPQDHLSVDELGLLAQDSSAGPWSPEEADLLLAVEETWSAGGVSTATWARLSRSLSEQQLYDLVMLIGYYLMTMSMLNSMGVPNLDDDPPAPWAQVDNGAPA